MKTLSETRAQNDALMLHSRRRFLKKVLVAAVYVTPLIVSYPPLVFACHCGMPGTHAGTMMCGGMSFSGMCTPL